MLVNQVLRYSNQNRDDMCRLNKMKEYLKTNAGCSSRRPVANPFKLTR